MQEPHAMIRLKPFFSFILVMWIMSRAAFAQLSPGDLHRAHAEIEKLKNCTKCHDAGPRIDPALCLDCHRVLKARVDTAKGLHARPDYRACEACHIEHQGRDGELILWKNGREKFDHALTGYELTGKHAGVACEKCHKPEFITEPGPLLAEKIDLKTTFLGLHDHCLSCHLDEHRGKLDSRCLNCHDLDGWKPAKKFDHDRTAYPLTGRHRQTACEKCHKNVSDNTLKGDDGFVQYKGMAFKQCRDCHTDIHKGKLAGPCETCHVPDSWKKTPENRFNHDRTNYPLTGKHQTVACDKCHLPGRPVVGLAFAACRDCHKDEHLGQFSKRTDRGACESCHSVLCFSPATYTQADHQKSGYPLQGAHRAVACLQCHDNTYTSGSARTWRFVFSDESCRGCHSDVHKGDVNGFLGKRGCENCHRVEAWGVIEFDHNQTRFRLSGTHLRTRCSGCHKTVNAGSANEGIQFKGVRQSCRDCHEDVHLGQFLQRRSDGGSTHEPTACSRCHSEDKWQPSLFDHDRDSIFRLEGAHKKLTCAACHKKEAIESDRRPSDHPLCTFGQGMQGLPRNIREKHRALTRQGKTMKATLLILLCAAAAGWTQEMPHEKMERDCRDCHDENNWRRVVFQHDQTHFPLQGWHKDLNCLLCHDVKDFSKTPAACAGCHIDVHQGKLNKNCDQCHTPRGWQLFDARRAHANTSFPLIGRHANLDCKTCHTGEVEGEFTPLQSECYACHQDVFRETKNPAHSDMNFSRRCEECHTLFSWHPADFGQHASYFGIYSGTHAGRWETCSTCHIVPGNYQEFSCYQNCHYHNQSAMDGRHREVRNYVYDSHRCYGCHKGA
jgi:hypothetical protein